MLPASQILWLLGSLNVSGYEFDNTSPRRTCILYQKIVQPSIVSATSVDDFQPWLSASHDCHAMQKDSRAARIEIKSDWLRINKMSPRRTCILYQKFAGSSTVNKRHSLRFLP